MFVAATIPSTRSRNSSARSRAQAATLPLAVPPAKAAALLSLGLTRTYVLMRRGELQSFHSGRACRIPMQSIHNYMARQLAGKSRQGSQTRRRKQQTRKGA